MYPHERSLVKQLKDKPFALIGINSDKDKNRLKRRMQEESITWRSFWCGPDGTRGRIPSQWNVQGWPTLYVIDANGVIRYKSYDRDEDGKRVYRDKDGKPFLRGEKLDQAVATLLTEVEGKGAK
jgi:hypothetical protein